MCLDSLALEMGESQEVAMTGVDESILQTYLQLQARFPAEVVGLLEIGSHARGEAVARSDHDLRLVICTSEPFLLLQEPVWTLPPPAVISYIGWEALNQALPHTVGLTNLGYVGRTIEDDHFPLNDHTCLYQGRILLDETGQVDAFRARYAGRVFQNIVRDYTQQVEWRVTQRLRREADPQTLVGQVDHTKQAIPMLHTCCRILRDLAHLSRYQSSGRYLEGQEAVAAYYREAWPDFYSTVERLFAYKTDETLRQTLFELVVSADPQSLARLQYWRRQIETLWYLWKRREVRDDAW
jgi:hypothetical protein